MNDATSLAFKLISEFEGCRLAPYRCPAGIWTIGYGNTRLPDGSRVNESTPLIKQEEADLMLTRSILEIETELKGLVQVPLNDQQQAALTSFVFNLGATAFANSTLLRMLNADDYDGAADQLLLWVHAGGEVLRGLTRRREAERALFLGL